MAKGNANAGAGVDFKLAYQSQVSLKARSGVIAAVVALHLGLLLALLNLSGETDIKRAQSSLSTILIRELLPPRQLERGRQLAKLRPTTGRSAPKNIRREAARVDVPKPIIEMTKVEQIAATQTPGADSAQDAGASSSVAQGSGAGGVGQGTGSGTGGSGSGAGGDGGAIEPPRLMTPVMSERDFSRDQLRQWPSGATVFLRLHINPEGHIAECIIDRGTGIAGIDGAICNLAHDRLSFRPALGRSGQNVAGWFGYAQPAPR